MSREDLFSDSPFDFDGTLAVWWLPFGWLLVCWLRSTLLRRATSTMMRALVFLAGVVVVVISETQQCLRGLP